MSKIFISYSSKDRPLVKELADDLSHLFDHHVWFDQELTRNGGHQWWNLIVEQIRLCEVFLYALSPQVLKSEPCKREYTYALALGKPVLPVILTDVEIRYLPVQLQAAQLVDYRQRTREQQRNLRLSIANLPLTPPLPPNALDLAPPAPLDPVGVLMDRISRLTTDPNQQRDLIRDIEDLSGDEGVAHHVLELLTRLLERDDVLIGRNIKRAEEIRVRIDMQLDVNKRIAYFNSLRVFPATVTVTPPSLEVAAGTRRTDSYGIQMVYVPAGKFLMGSSEDDGNDNEHPQHEQIILQNFWLDLTPVTNEAYGRFIAAGGYKNADYWTEAGWTWVQNEKKSGPADVEAFTDPQQPRVAVSWFEAYAYAQWRGGRLPTEAEWEWAARGSENRMYPWGNSFDPSRVIYGHKSGFKTAAVGDGVRQAGASWVGALDMSGNVWEWCSSLYLSYPYGSDDGREDSLEGNNRRVVRGGTWGHNQSYVRAACRSGFSPSADDNLTIGFRVVCVLPSHGL